MGFYSESPPQLNKSVDTREDPHTLQTEFLLSSPLEGLLIPAKAESYSQKNSYFYKKAL